MTLNGIPHLQVEVLTGEEESEGEEGTGMAMQGPDGQHYVVLEVSRFFARIEFFKFSF